MEGDRSMQLISLSRLLAAGLVVLMIFSSAAFADTTLSTNGDTSYESVYFGYGGSPKEDLSKLLANYQDPLTGDPSPITNPDGSPISVGAVDLGEDPSLSDQTQVQRLFTDADQQYKLTYLGLGYAAYHNIMGVYTREAGEDDPSKFSYTPLVTQGVDTPGTEVIFGVPADTTFGFYLSADGGRTERNRFFSENRFNSDGNGQETDHMLGFHTNRGFLTAWEDLPLGCNGKLGDQDYEDLVGGLLTYPDGGPVPEPTTMALLGGGFGFMMVLRATRGRRRRRASKLL